MTAEATFAGTLPAIPRTEDHRYFYEGVPYPGVSDVLGVLGKLVITDAVKQAGALGTAVHENAELLVNGVNVDLAHMEPRVRKRVEHYARWWEKSGWRKRLVEAPGIRPRTDDQPYGWGGTLDLLAYDIDDLTTLADIKTGSLLQKHILQLAGYEMLEYISPSLSSPELYRMPEVHRRVIIHVTEDGVREVEVSVGANERMAFLATLDVYNWMQTAKGRRL